MSKMEEMPKREDYEIHAGIWDSPQYMKDLESFCTQQAERIKELEEIRCNFVEMLRDCTLMQQESDMQMIKRKAIDILSAQVKGETEK